MKPKINVVGALINNKENKILICQRPKNKRRGLLWEFVGGKVEKKESLEDALIRECKEELDIIVNPYELFSETEYSYPDQTVHLFIFKSSILSGVPKLKEHNDIKWVNKTELDNFEFCPADIQILKKIKELE